MFEGEMLVLDPKRDEEVLGYVRLRSAAPDVGHFADALASPLLARDQALDMVDRYYAALNANDAEMLDKIIASGWTERGTSPSVPDRDAAGFLDEVTGLTAGLDAGTFTVDDVYLAENEVTVRGTITGKHTCTILDVPATGRDVALGAIAVHRIADGRIVESWQMVDWPTLLRLITE